MLPGWGCGPGERRQRCGAALPSPSRAPLAAGPTSRKCSSHSLVTWLDSQTPSQQVGATVELCASDGNALNVGGRCPPLRSPSPETNLHLAKKHNRKYNDPRLQFSSLLGPSKSCWGTLAEARRAVFASNAIAVPSRLLLNPLS
jgi:hypothetical protein